MTGHPPPAPSPSRGEENADGGRRGDGGVSGEIQLLEERGQAPFGNGASPLLLSGARARQGNATTGPGLSWSATRPALNVSVTLPCHNRRHPCGKNACLTIMRCSSSDHPHRALRSKKPGLNWCRSGIPIAFTIHPTCTVKPKPEYK